MPTYAQLQAEPWWGREMVTPELDWLGDELCRRTKRPRAAAGTKGDNNHLSGGHRSQEWILKSRYCTSRTYTAQSGLTATQARHVAAFDFTPGSAEQMIAQCRRLIAAMRAGRLDEVRAIYGNVDGDKVVDGWDNVRNRAASSDSSHLWHWHLTIDRRHCANKKLMERILAIALGDDLEDDMPLTAQDLDRVRSAAAKGLYDALTVAVSGKDFRDLRYSGEGSIGASVRANFGALAAGPVLAALDGRDFTDEPAIVAGVLAGLSPESIAAAIPLDLADRVADELARRLAAGG